MTSGYSFAKVTAVRGANRQSANQLLGGQPSGIGKHPGCRGVYRTIGLAFGEARYLRCHQGMRKNSTSA